MKKLSVLVLAGLLLFGYRVVFAEIEGEIGITATEQDTNIYTRIEAKKDLDIVEFKMGVEIEKARSNEQTTRDNFKMWASYQENFEDLFISGNIEFENDDVQSFQRTSVIGSVGKEFKIDEIDLTLETGLGYSWANILSNSAVFSIKEEAVWKTLYQKGRFLSPIDNINEMEVSLEIGVKTKLTETLSLKTGYEFEYRKFLEDKYEHTFRTSLNFNF